MRRFKPSEETAHVNDLADRVRELARPLRKPADLDPLLERIGEARYVLLGEASHGTGEYYTWRARLTRRLIREKGFSFVAVEGDWPDCYRVNRYVKGLADAGASAPAVLHDFQRWPTWMWANEEVAALAGWLRRHNDTQPAGRKVGFYGLDVYSLWDSLYAVMNYLREADPAALPAARRAYHCFEPFGEDVQAYARASALVPTSCEDEAVDLLTRLRQGGARHDNDGAEGHFVAEQNALVLKNAEAYYRAMVRGGPESWNLRDGHMTETLERLMHHHGPDARGIVWAHNTHVGDARYTDMADEGMENLGSLVREGHEAEGVVLVGFGAHRGHVIAGREWDAPWEVMEVPPGRPGSWEDVLHTAGPTDKLLVWPAGDPTLAAAHGHRAIGVVYHPEYEQYGNYVPTVLSRRYDAFLYLDESHALHPLHVPVRAEEVPETYPSGV